MVGDAIRILRQFVRLLTRVGLKIDDLNASKVLFFLVDSPVDEDVMQVSCAGMIPSPLNLSAPRPFPLLDI